MSKKFKGMLHTLEECEQLKQAFGRTVLCSERLRVSSDLDETIFRKEDGKNPPSLIEVAENYDGRVLNGRYGLDGATGKGYNDPDAVMEGMQQPFESDIHYQDRMKETANPNPE